MKILLTLLLLFTSNVTFAHYDNTKDYQAEVNKLETNINHNKNLLAKVQKRSAKNKADLDNPKRKLIDLVYTKQTELIKTIISINEKDLYLVEKKICTYENPDKTGVNIRIVLY